MRPSVAIAVKTEIYLYFAKSARMSCSKTVFDQVLIGRLPEA